MTEVKITDGIPYLAEIKKLIIEYASSLGRDLSFQNFSAELDDLEAKIIKTMTDRFEGVANVDEIIVGLYRDFEYITEDRRQLANKLYRMQKASLLDAVPKLSWD